MKNMKTTMKIFGVCGGLLIAAFLLGIPFMLGLSLGYHWPLWAGVLLTLATFFEIVTVYCCLVIWYVENVERG